MAVADRRFHAMGVGVHVVVNGPGAEELVDRAEQRIEALERRWSRFLDDSEISRLNAGGGAPLLVSPETFALADRMVEAWRATGGRFDPTVLPSLVAAGYDRTFEEIGLAPWGDGRGPGRAPGLDGVVIDRLVTAVTLPSGTSVDPGGIGKGFAADIVVDELLDQGAAGVLVNIGGDLRASGVGPDGGGWVVSVESPFDRDVEVARIAVDDGAVVTSAPSARSWRRGDETVHHLIDPATGEPLQGGPASVTVVAGEAWWAEVVAKSVLVAGHDNPQEIERLGATGFTVGRDGRRHDAAGLSEVLV